MHITLSITNPDPGAEDQDLLSFEVWPEMTADTLRSSIEAEARIPKLRQYLYHDGRLITDYSKTLAQLQITDGDMLGLHVREASASQARQQQPAQRQGNAQGNAQGTPQGTPQEPPQGAPQGPGHAARLRQDPEYIRLQYLGDPEKREQLQRHAPELAAAVDDAQRFAHVYSQILEREQHDQAERQRQIQLLNADPFDVEAQAKIEEIIRQERVTENLQNAMEHNPEVFGRVHMLYLDVEVNGHRVKALVDSGAQATIMSPSCAEACGIMRLVDKRFAGVAKGVGTAAILGRVHSAQIKIGALFLPCSFTVMEGKSVELLLGLDMLKRHQACIDLAKDKLIIQGIQVPFLGEADIPKETEAAIEAEPKVKGPAGTSIGARSGAVTAPVVSAGQAGLSDTTTVPAAGPAVAPAAATATNASTQPSTAPPYPREQIEQLMALGASEQKAIRALEATDGNVEYAAGLIFED